MDANIIKDIALAAGKLVPRLAGFLLGPLGSVGVSLLESLFGVSSDKLSNVITNDGTALEKLMSFASEHKELIAQYQAQGYEAEVQDRVSARELSKNPKDDRIQHILAICFTLGFFGYVALKYLQPECFDKEIFNNLVNMAMLVYSFYFGSSFKSNR